MPKNLTDDASVFPTQTAPLAGEPRTAGSVETPFQNAANRAAWLKDRLDNIDPTREGARRLRRFASIAALRASGDYPDKTIAQVDGVGIYQFDAAATALAAEPFVVTPTAIGAGAGRWLWSSFGALNVANGIPQLDGSAKLPTALLAASDGVKITAPNVRNGLLDIQMVFELATYSTSSGSFVDIPAPSIALNLAVGDRVLLMHSFSAFLGTGAGASDFGQTQIAVVTPALSTLGISGASATVRSRNGNETYHLHTIYTAGAAGSHTFKPQYLSQSAQPFNVQFQTFTALPYRP